ncbi:KAT8 regulatory NSL complex subunit 1 [Prorops nasuta]|uniref:KAT8 regulatory NSL complex subunit 1 n=1 Tax=Prorops nasuta TaxID=863751 RepID=UPI0034CE1D1E
MGASRTQKLYICKYTKKPLDVETTAVAVMAPALTEGGPQKQEKLLLTLPAGGFLSSNQATKIYQNREIFTEFVVSTNVKPSIIDKQYICDLSKTVLHNVINSKYVNGIRDFPAFNHQSNLISRKNLINQDFVQWVAPNNPEQKLTDFIMNDSSKTEDTNNMGFFKSDRELPSMSAESTSEGKNLDVDQIMTFKTDSASDNVQCNIANAGDIGQNVEEILQVIKSIENVETVENMSVSGSEPVQSTVDSVEMFTIPEEGFSSFERDLLNDVDVMSLCTDNINLDSTDQQKTNSLRLQQDLVAQKQFESERKCAFLLRRLRKLQARVIGKHIAEENIGIVELAHRGVKKYLFPELVDISSNSNSQNFSEITNSLIAFLKKLEKMCIAQSNSVSRQRLCIRYFGGGSQDSLGNVSNNNSNRPPIFGSSQLQLNGDQLENVAGPLTMQLHVVESNLDSDCTASSSGGESCDEMQSFNNPHQQHLCISKRGTWKYAQERACVASKWTWLQAQISDLEYKIRQHNELQRHIRASKGLVVLDNTEALNGFNAILSGCAGNFSSSESEVSCSRTRPFVWNCYKKRKLIQMNRLHEVSKQAVKCTTIRCNCDCTLPACALCTDKIKAVQWPDSFDQSSIQERVATVEPGFHSVLSFPDDISHGIHLEAIMKSVEWQQKIIKGSSRVPRIKQKEDSDRSGKLCGHRVKYTTHLKKSSALLTARIKRKMLKGKRNRLTHERNIQIFNKKKVPKLAPEDEEEISALSSSSKYSSPVPSPLQHPVATAEKTSFKDKGSNFHGRLRQNSYDIDNIVIPYSVAASTRLEKLQYKEILTPKWRVCEEPSRLDLKNGAVHNLDADSDFEDVSDETIALRHERSEREENKRFMTYINMPHQARMKQARRTDSKADSGTNTPDPMSPHASDFSGDVISPVMSPAALSVIQDIDQKQQNLESPQRSSVLNNVFRRRPVSNLRCGRDDISGIWCNEEENEVVPYEPRLFPISEDIYEKMLEVMPGGHWHPSSLPMCSREEDKREDDVDMDTPESDSTESACCDIEGEDPNDPEWTVADDGDAEKEGIRLTAKR